MQLAKLNNTIIIGVTGPKPDAISNLSQRTSFICLFVYLCTYQQIFTLATS